MRQFIVTTLGAALLALGAGALAGEKSVTLVVKNMTCASCPYIVKQSLSRIDGVQSVEVSLEKKKAIVQYDDTKTSVKALTDATTNQGFPSSLLE